MADPQAWQATPERGWEALTPRQLLLLAATMTVALLPHAAALPAWLLAGAALAAGWRLGVALGWWPLPGTLLRVVLTFGAVFAVTLYYRRITGIDAGSALLITMMALKLLETRGLRDRSIVILIAWFVLFAGFLREQSLLSIPQLLAGILVGVLALLQNLRPGRWLAPRDALGITGRLLAQALPLAVVLFLLFPRLPGPFWATPVGGSGSSSGLTDQMNPGDITSLALSDRVAFRVRFDGDAPPAAARYWRGPVLDQFDGRRWRATPAALTRNARPPWPGPGVTAYDYEIILEPHGERWLVPLDSPLDWNLSTATLSPSVELLSRDAVDRRLAYRARSAPAGAFRPADPPESRTRFVPSQRNPRAAQFARELRARSASDADFAARVLRHFREEAFFYTLEPPALGNNAVDDFLFGTRAGFCEHYASAFALLARAAGIPARVVAGYQGGEWNPIGAYWIVRQSDAHAWTELWLGDRWVRFDPTGAVAPERIESGLEAALPGGTGDALPLLGDGQLLDRVALSWDALNATWDRWVLAFGPERQADLLRGLGLRAPTLRDIALACAGAVALLLLGFALLDLRKPRPVRSPLEAAWDLLCRRLGAVVRPRHPAEGPAEYAAAVATARPDLGPPVQALARRYLRLRYEGGAAPAEVARFRQDVGRFRPGRRPPVPVSGPGAPAPG